MKKITVGLVTTLFINLNIVEAKKLPNIIFIMSDDVGYGDVSYNGGKIKTENIDLLAKNGVQFTQAYSVASTSSPSRYSLLTGQYAFRKNVGILEGDAPMSISSSALTLPMMLKKVGYTTACVGKWHLGLGDGNLDYNKTVKPSPNERGFDYSFIIPATNDRVPCVYLENGNVVNLDPNDPIQVSYTKHIGNMPTGEENPELLKMPALSKQHKKTIVDGISRIGYMSGGKSALWKDEEMADVIAGKAVKFIKSNAQKPFFLYFATHNIHEPRIASPRSSGQSGYGIYGDVILDLDWSVGQIMNTLRELKLDKNTLIVFMSDNGPRVEEGYDDGGLKNLKDHKPAGELRGGKYSLFEGGTRLPFIVYWPQKVKPGISTAIVSQIDLFASLAKLTKVKLKKDDAPDSREALSTFFGKSRNTKFKEVLIQNNGGAIALRKGDWKYIQGKDKEKEIKGELYNLKDDIGEKNNLVDSKPALVKEFQKRITEIRQSSSLHK